jgi:DNA-binding transcriptional MerR regulator
MTTLRIAEVAERTGVPATTLRYYEDIGLLSPAERAANGYRAYSERDVDRLQFISRAKGLDLGLDELRELVSAWDSDDCGGVQERMAQVVADRIAQAQHRIVDLVELAAQLQAAAARLAGTPPQPGGCDAGCACSTAAGAAREGGTTFVALTRPLVSVPPAEAGGGVPAIACTLDRGAMRGRIEDWQAVLARATGREPIPGGAALTFGHDADLTAELARLAAAEHACCGFFDFSIAVTGAGVRFEVRAPVEAQDVLASVFGPAGAVAP